MSITDSDLDEMQRLVNILSDDKGPDVKVMATTIIESARELDGPEINGPEDITLAMVNQLSINVDAVFLAVSILTGDNDDSETTRMLAYGMMIGHKLAMKQVHA